MFPRDSATGALYRNGMSERLSLEELSEKVNGWCEAHGVLPASGGAGEKVSERNIRYYRTLGLIEAPAMGFYGEKHFLQIVALRILQSRGVPLRQIRELLYGRSEADLKEVQRRALEEISARATSSPFSAASAEEIWRTIPINEDFILISRRGTPITAAQRNAVVQALQPEDKQMSRSKKLSLK